MSIVRLLLPLKSLTAEKAREILKEVKEAQETFKKQRETIKLEAEVLCVHISVVLVNYSGTPLNGHPSTADTHNITDNSESPDCPSVHFNTSATPEQRTPHYSI